MVTHPPDIDTSRIRLAMAFDSFQKNSVRLASDDLSGFSQLVASRQGLFAVNESGFRLVAHGFYFGISYRGSAIYAFEACDMPHSATRMGRIVRFERDGDRITEAIVVAIGLDNGCHQIDFIGESLCVVDTYNQQIIRFSANFTEREILCPLPVKAAGRWEKTDPEYVHLNSILAVQDCILLLLHNGAQHTGRSSELAVCDSEWNIQARVTLNGSGCHGLAVLEDGSVLTCGSMNGEIISLDGLRVHVTPHMTRGLAVGTDSIAVGSSRLAKRDDRIEARGNVTFLDRSYHQLAVVELPGGVTEVRRLDAQDASLSNYLAEHASTQHPRLGLIRA